MYRTFVIIRHTFFESIVQPIYSLLLAVGAAILVIFAMLPFFTLGEDTVMYKSVGLDVILILVLITTLFATSRSIFEEIEDRTMLTLMSKPLKRWQVLVGKYLGIILAALVAVAILGGILILCTWARLPSDYMLSTNSLDERELRQIFEMRIMQIAGLFPSLILLWLQISVLAAIGVALSTRFSLVVNLPIVIILYIAGNLTRFLFPLAGTGPLAEPAVDCEGVCVRREPAVALFGDVRSQEQDGLRDHQDPAHDVREQSAGGYACESIWSYTGVSFLYAAAYAAFALAVGMWLFQTRELGGAEG